MLVQVYYFLTSKHLIKNKVKGGHAALRGVVRCFVASFFPRWVPSSWLTN